MFPLIAKTFGKCSTFLEDHYSEFNNGWHMWSIETAEWARWEWKSPVWRRSVSKSLKLMAQVPFSATGGLSQTCSRCPQLCWSLNVWLVLLSRMDFHGNIQQRWPTGSDIYFGNFVCGGKPRPDTAA